MQQNGPLMRPWSVEFTDFVAARGSALYRYGYVLTGNAEDAADLTQEALMRLGDAWPKIRKKDDPEGYVRTTMARLHISVWRRLRRERLVAAVRPTSLLPPPSSSSSPPEAKDVGGRFGSLGAYGDGEQNADGYVPVTVVYDPISDVMAGISKMDPSAGGGFGTGISSSPSSILYWDEGKKQVRECKTVDGRILPSQPPGEPVPTGESTVCSTKEVGGGKELTVVNLLAVPPTE